MTERCNPQANCYRRQTLAAVFLLMLFVSACSKGKDKAVDLDLRQPTSPRQLNSSSAYGYSVSADADAMLQVTLRLPDATVAGEFKSLVADTVAATDDPDSPLSNIALFDPDVKTLNEVKVIIQDFEKEWGIDPASIVDRDTFLTKAAGFVDAKGQPQNIGAGTDPNFVFGIRGVTKGTLQPSLTIRPGNGYFSTYRSFAWDPNATLAEPGS